MFVKVKIPGSNSGRPLKSIGMHIESIDVKLSAALCDLRIYILENINLIKLDPQKQIRVSQSLRHKLRNETNLNLPQHRLKKLENS